MKNSPLGFISVAALALAQLLHGAETAAAPSTVYPKAVTRTMPSGGESRDLADARLELELLQQTYGPASAQVKSQLARIDALERREPLRFKILDFKGGSIRTLVESSSKLDGPSLSIIAAHDPADLGTELPAFVLRNATPRTALQVLNPLLRPKGFTLEIVGDGDGSPVGILQRMNNLREEKRPQPARFESYQIAGALKEQKIEEITDAIRTAVDFKFPGLSKDLQLKFHPATTLLLASGSDDAIRVTQTIVSQLRGMPPRAFSSVLEERRPFPSNLNTAEDLRRLEDTVEEIQTRRMARDAVSAIGSDLSARSNVRTGPSPATARAPETLLETAQRQRAVYEDIERRRNTREGPVAPAPTQTK